MVQNLWAESETPAVERFSPNFPRPFSASSLRTFELVENWLEGSNSSYCGCLGKSFWVETPEGLVWPNLGRIGGSVKGSFLPLKDCGLRLKQAEHPRLVMQTHLTVIRSVTFDTATTSSVYLGRSPIDVIFHFLFLLLSGKYIPSAFPFGVLHQYQGKKWRHKKSQQNSVYHDAATTTEFPTRICYFVVSHVGFRLAGSSCIPTGRLLLVFLFDLN